jgi:uncharacterized protein YegL
MIECKEFHLFNRQNVDQVRTDLSRFGANLAEFRKKEAGATESLAEADSELNDVVEEKEKHDKEYEEQRGQDEVELSKRKNDLAVADFIMGATKCPKEGTLLQHKTGHGVLSCASRRRGMDNTIQKFADPAVQARLEQLMRGNSQDMVQRALRQSVAGMNWHGLSFLEEGKPQLSLVSKKAYNAEEVPTQPAPTDAPATTADPTKQFRKCSMGKPNCALLHDNMAMMWGEMKDAVDELQAEMDEREREYKELCRQMNDHIAALTATKAAFQNTLGEATAGINANVDAQNEKHEELAQFEAEYKDVWGACEATLQNLVFTRMCGTKKVRGELADQLSGEGDKKPDIILDCEVGEFIPGQCSSACDQEMKGGNLMMTREVIQNNNDLGTLCPANEYAMRCNQIKCPVNCKMSKWSAFSKCSKECESGVQSRTRFIITEPKNGGESCDVNAESRPCNTGSCDRDCHLHDWSKRAPCSQACDSGYSERFRAMRQKARGQGKCPKKDSELRHQIHKCNEQACVGDETCIAKMDMIIAFDASGSVTEKGFKTMQNYTGELIKRYKGDAYEGGAMRVGVIEFGNGEIMEDGSISAALMIQTLTKDIKSVVPKIAEMKWQKGFTNMAQAFTLAKTMFMSGRQHAQSSMLVVTDGKPNFKFQTKKAVMELRDQGVHVNIVAIREHQGEDELDLMKDWCSVPWESHFTHIAGLLSLSQDTDAAVTKTIVQTCPRAESPKLVAAAAKALGFKLVGENRDCPSWWNDLGRYDNVEDCKNAAKQAGVKAFVFGKGPFDYWGGACFAEKNSGTTCGYGWVQSSFDHYELVEGGGETVGPDEGDKAFLMLPVDQVVEKPARPAPGVEADRMASH